MPDRSVGVKGPLGPLAEGFADELGRLGYKPAPASKQLVLLAELSEWLEEVGVAPAELTTEAVAEFLQERRRRGETRLVSPIGIRTLIGYLRGAGAAPEPSRRVAVGPTEQLLERYHRFLVDDRPTQRARLALAAATGQVVQNGLAVLGIGAPNQM